jgi:ketosteroid isomerase-like protein
MGVVTRAMWCRRDDGAMSDGAERRITAGTPEAAVAEWFERLGAHCVAGEYAAARAIVAPDVVSFGTKADVVTGLDHLQANQWEGIWPNIEGFGFDHESVHAGGHEDLAWGVATWESVGFDESGEPFHRPGRATVVLERRDGDWLAVHTHFSLFSGTPPRTFGPDGRA